MAASFLERYGLDCIDNGYTVIPIAEGEKYPKGFLGWQRPDLPQDIDTVMEWCQLGYTGVGIRCDNVVGIDLDILEPYWMGDILQLTETLTPMRYGNLPKTLLLIRTTEPMPWYYSPTFSHPNGIENHFEIISGIGRQFVAYHNHPDVDRAYTWEDDIGPHNLPWEDLPLWTPAHLRSFVIEAENYMLSNGSRVDGPKGDFEGYFGAKAVADTVISIDQSTSHQDAVLANYKPPQGTELATIRQYLDQLEQWRCDQRDEWIAVLAAIHHETAESDYWGGMVLAREWSAKSHKYDPNDFDRVYESFKDDPSRPALTIASLQHKAKLDSPPVSEPPPPSFWLNISDFMREVFPPEPMWFAPFFGPGTGTMLFGPPGVGKTFHVMYLLRCLHHREPLYQSLPYTTDSDIPIPPPRTLWLDGEMTGSLLQQRLNHVFTQSGFDLPPDDELIIFSLMHAQQHNPDVTLNLATKEGRDVVLEKLTDMRANLLVIDNKAALVMGLDSNSEDDNAPVVSFLRHVMAMGVAVILIHHEGKSGTQRGTSAYEGPLDNVMRLRPGKGKGSSVRIENTLMKHRRGLPSHWGEAISLESTGSGVLPYMISKVSGYEIDGNRAVLENFVRCPRLAHVERAADLGVGVRTLKSKVQWLVGEGYLERVDGTENGGPKQKVAVWEVTEEGLDWLSSTSEFSVVDDEGNEGN